MSAILSGLCLIGIAGTFFTHWRANRPLGDVSTAAKKSIVYTMQLVGWTVFTLTVLAIKILTMVIL